MQNYDHNVQQTMLGSAVVVREETNIANRSMYGISLPCMHKQCYTVPVTLRDV